MEGENRMREEAEGGGAEPFPQAEGGARTRSADGVAMDGAMVASDLLTLG